MMRCTPTVCPTMTAGSDGCQQAPARARVSSGAQRRAQAMLGLSSPVTAASDSLAAPDPVCALCIRTCGARWRCPPAARLPRTHKRASSPSCARCAASLCTWSLLPGAQRLPPVLLCLAPAALSACVSSHVLVLRRRLHLPSHVRALQVVQAYTSGSAPSRIDAVSAVVSALPACSYCAVLQTFSHLLGPS